MAAYSYSAANIILNVRALLNEATADFWTDVQLTAYIDEAIRVIAERTGCYRTTASVNTVAATRTVSFTGYKCLAIEYNKSALVKIVPSQVGHIKIDGVTPQYWFELGSTAVIIPTPDIAYALTLYLQGVPAAIGATTPVLPYSVCSIIPYFVAARAFEQDRMIGPANHYMSMFNNELDFISTGLLPNYPA